MSLPDFNSIVQNVVNRVIGDDARPTLSDSTKRTLLSYTVEYHVQDDFTVAVVSSKRGVESVGVSKRNPDDRFNALRGKALALSRAVKKIADRELHKNIDGNVILDIDKQPTGFITKLNAWVNNN